MTTTAYVTVEHSAEQLERVTRPVRRRELRPGRGTGRRSRPQARPARSVSAPSLVREAAALHHGCRPGGAPSVVRRGLEVPAGRGWRLTDRGIALVLATALALATAALVVVALTALRVTGDGYAPGGQLTAVHR